MSCFQYPNWVPENSNPPVRVTMNEPTVGDYRIVTNGLKFAVEQYTESQTWFGFGKPERSWKKTGVAYFNSAWHFTVHDTKEAAEATIHRLQCEAKGWKPV